jgi:flagellar motility protein MotE (MotC chaperone)
MNVPRLLPLIGVAVAGVIAVNALAGARDLPQMLSTARALAEGVAAPDKSSKGAKAVKASADVAMTAASTPPAQSTVSIIPAGVCAPNAAELAKSAGLSPAELQLLQNLQNRRGQIDQREKDLDTQVQLLTAAETKLDAKLKAMSALKSQIEALMGQADQKTQGEVDRLVVVYSKMKPQDSAAVMSQLDDKVRVPVAAAMKPTVLAAILSKMSPVDAKTLTELLAHRFAPVQQLADAARSPPAAQPPTAPPAPTARTAKSASKPKAQADTDADPDDANVDDVSPKKVKPVKIAKRAPAKKKPAVHAPKPKPAADEAKAKAPAAPRPVSEVKDVQPKPADPPAAAAAAAAKAS